MCHLLFNMSTSKSTNTDILQFHDMRRTTSKLRTKTVKGHSIHSTKRKGRICFWVGVSMSFKLAEDHWDDFFFLFII